jgi:predicted nucleotidyltransferase
MIEDKVKKEIIGKISIKKPYKVLLFGSHAYGSPEKESDVDLLVVIDKEGIPETYQEKSENYLEISRLLRDINKKISIDILVMTKTQWFDFINKKSGFSREILSRGIELI